MSFKKLYQFTIDKEVEKIEETSKKDRKTGEEVTTKKTVKVKEPIEFFIKYPQFQIQDFFINNNVATPQMLFDYIRQTGGYINWYKISSSSGCDETVLEL